MRFCKKCNNILIPRNNKLYCQACDEEFDLKDNKDDFKIIKKIRHDDAETAPIVSRESFKSKRISDQDRKAYEEFFNSSEDSNY
ncbi:MAG: hypothetical protein ACTSRI_02100 [Promethearchaeota archaeon]